MAPLEEAIGLLIVKSEPAPVEIIPTVPFVVALTAPLTVTDPAEAVNEINPAAFVVIVPTVKLPVAKVKVKFILLAVTVLSVRLDTVVVTVYAVRPMPL